MNSYFSSEFQAKFSRLNKPEEFLPKLKCHGLDNGSGLEIEDTENNDISDSDQVQQQSKEDLEDKSERTLFIGNLPVSMTIHSLRKLCKSFGEIESARLRSIPIAGTAVDDAGNQTLVRKVCAIKRNFGDQKGSMNAYVVFKSLDSVTSALRSNNVVVEGRHLRFDRMVPSEVNPKKSVFIGGLPRFVDEEALRQHFAEVLVNGQEDIEYVRIVRDPYTLEGRGIGFVCFNSSDCLIAALSLHQKEFQKRQLRVMLCNNNNRKDSSNAHNRADFSNNSQSNLNITKTPKRKHRDRNATNPPVSSEDIGTEKALDDKTKEISSISAKKQNSITIRSNSNDNDAFPRANKSQSIKNQISGNNQEAKLPKFDQAKSTGVSSASIDKIMKSHAQAVISNAQRRINLKAVKTRSKVLVSKGQMAGRVNSPSVNQVDGDKLVRKHKNRNVSGSIKKAIKAQRSYKH